MTGISMLLALLMDRIFGEVRRFHPLVGFGRVARRVERSARALMTAPIYVTDAATQTSPLTQLWAGALSWCLLVVPPTVLLWAIQHGASNASATIIGIIVLYFCIGGRSLKEHAQAVAQPLMHGDLAAAREQLSRIVSRDTAHLDEQAVTKATVESVLENGSDALLAPLLWFVLAGAPGVLCYRLCNTLDAMWGYRTPRYLYFGRVAARADDVLNWLPARCCALSYAAGGQWRVARRCWRAQAFLCDSPNAGPVMAAGAGALGIVLGGPATYHNKVHWRPTLGEGRAAKPVDIARALGLLQRATLLWLAVVVLWEVLA